MLKKCDRCGKWKFGCYKAIETSEYVCKRCMIAINVHNIAVLGRWIKEVKDMLIKSAANDDRLVEILSGVQTSIRGITNDDEYYGHIS